MDIDVGFSGEQRSELCAAEHLLFGEPVSWIAAILHEPDLDRAVDTRVCEVQMGGAVGVVQASGIDVQRQQRAGLVERQRGEPFGVRIDKRHLLLTGQFRE